MCTRDMWVVQGYCIFEGSVEMSEVVGVGLYWKLIGTIMGTCTVMPELRGITSACHLKHSWLLEYNSFILTVGIIGVDSHARDMYDNGHSQGTYVLLEIPHPCIN